MWREGKELKGDLKEVTSFKGSGGFNILMKVTFLYINIGETSSSFFTLETITIESQMDMANG